MPEEQQIGIMANLPRLLAQEAIQHGRYDPVDHEAVATLYQRAYEDEDLTRRARLEAMKRLVRQETEAARLSRAT